MKKKQLTKLAKRSFYISLAMIAGMFQTSCLDEIVPGNYYTFTGETIADYLESRDSIFSDYIFCLKEAGRWGEMSSYGNYTLFAPTNSSFQKLFDEWGVGSIEALAKKIDDMRETGEYLDRKYDLLDTIALTHLIETTFYCSDLKDGSLPYPNMLDRYLVYTTGELYDINAEGDTIGRDVAYFINKTSRIVQRDDSVQNGVVHIMTDIVEPSNNNLADQIVLDEDLQIFTMILKETGMDIELSNAHIDPTYPNISVDSTTVVPGKTIRKAVGQETGDKAEYILFPKDRKMLYTLMAVQDDVMVEEINSVLGTDYTEEEIIANPQLAYQYAENLYSTTEPEFILDYDADNFRDRNNPLNRFISYHILPYGLSYNNMHFGDELQPDKEELSKIKKGFVAWDSVDVEDFYQTLLPNSIVRISTTENNEIYINRKGTQKFGEFIPGVKILPAGTSDKQQDALNGQYHYIEKPIVYSEYTRKTVLNTRLRFMSHTLSPDFINSHARKVVVYDGVDGVRTTMSFLEGYCKNIEISKGTTMMVRTSDVTKTVFRGEEINFVDKYDITITLPPVPYTSTYEVRLGMHIGSDSRESSDRGVIQVYFGEENSDLHPCGVPIDLTLPADDPRVGGINDNTLFAQGGDEAIIANDKAMRNRGYMKGMASYASGSSNGDLLRKVDQYLRIILTTEYMQPNKTYKLRIRLVGGHDGVCPIGVIELVPKSVYANSANPEDKF